MKRTKPLTEKQKSTNDFIARIHADAERRRREQKLPADVLAKEKQLDDEAAELYREANGPSQAPNKLDSVDLYGRIVRDGRPETAFDLIGDFQPAMQVNPADLLPMAQEIREAKQRVEEARLKLMSDEEKELHALEKLQADLLAKEQAAADHAKRLADPKIKTTLERLRALDKKVGTDESWSLDEVQTVARAIYSIEYQGSDLDAALALASTAFGHEARKTAEAMSAHEAELARLKAQMELLTGQNPADVTPRADTKAESKPAADPTLQAELTAAEAEYLGDGFWKMSAAEKVAAGSRYDAALAAVSGTPADDAKEGGE